MNRYADMPNERLYHIANAHHYNKGAFMHADDWESVEYFAALLSEISCVVRSRVESGSWDMPLITSSGYYLAQGGK